MTAEQFGDSKYKPVLMPMPFGADDPSANYDIPSVDSVPNAPNFEDGFPSAFSSPKSLNGQYVTRKQMNGIGNLATRYEFFRRVGGLNTFDADFAIEIGGYPMGCVLDFLCDNKLYKVLSLVNNNKVDYRGGMLTAEQITNGIVSGAVDGINWIYCNVDASVKYTFELCEIPNFTWTQPPVASGVNFGLHDVFQIGNFKAPKSGVLSFSGSYDFSMTLASNYQSGQAGMLIAVCWADTNTDGVILPPTNTSANVAYIYARATPKFYPDGTVSSLVSEKSVRTLTVDAGKLYSVYIVNIGGTITDSTLKVILQ